ncbi:Tic20 family protein [Prochlorococcus marinus]|uniref:Tic20 family protein n=1 Tax=Prochlorococcus marinus TaxID=1219 RepID=UPI0022B49718|nr:Tic20 family protein [Prochlorococcus marinus]
MPSLGEKILGIILYMIPWSESLIFGNHLFIKYPFTQIIQIPAIPIILIERSIPFGSLLLFLAIFIGLVRNTKVSYFMRFNALQSLLINIGIIIVSFTFEIISSTFSNTLIIRTFSSTLLISLFLVILYCVWSCTQGNEPNLPGISQATKMQL